MSDNLTNRIIYSQAHSVHSVKTEICLERVIGVKVQGVGNATYIPALGECGGQQAQGTQFVT